MLREIAVIAGSLAVGAAAAIAVARHAAAREPPPGWADVVVLGRGGAPLEGVTLHWEENGPASARTDSRGVARIDLTGHDDSPAVFLGGTLPCGDYDKASKSFAQKVCAPRTVLRLPHAIPFEVTFIDGRTGDPLAGGDVRWPREPPNAALQSSRVTVHRLFQNWYHAWLEADAPPGFVVPTERLGVEPIDSASVERQRMTIPVWPAGRVRVQVFEPGGRPAVGDMRVGVRFGGWREPVWTSVVADADGRFDFQSLPLVPHAIASVEVECDREQSGSSAIEILDGQSAFDVVVILATKRDGVRCGGAFGGDVHYDKLPPGGDATLRLRVFHSDGDPARRARVRLRTRPLGDHSPFAAAWETSVVTDDDGRASRSDLCMTRIQDGKPLQLTVVLDEPGLNYASMDVPLLPGGTAECELREPAGGTIDLTVIGRWGRPVPFARISARSADRRDWTWYVVEGGVHDAAPRTDVDGRIVLRGLPPGGIRVTAVSCGQEADDRFFTGEPATLVISGR